jgi:hypothetical protein
MPAMRGAKEKTNDSVGREDGKNRQTIETEEGSGEMFDPTREAW